MQHPHVVLIEIAVLKCLWLYATCVEQQRTWLSYRIMRYSLYFCMSGRAFLVSGVLKAQSRGKSWRVRDTRDLRTMCLQQGTSVAELREKCRCPVSWTCCARTEQFSPRCISLSSLHNSSWRLELCVNSTTAKPCACPQCLCACLWEGVCICGCHCLPGLFLC